jgi:type II secretory pathway pseudopilin PulG
MALPLTAWKAIVQKFNSRREWMRLLAAAVVGMAAGLLLWQDLGRMHEQSGRLDTERAQLRNLQSAADKARRSAQKAQKNNAGSDEAAAGAAQAIALLQRIEAAWTADIALLRLVADMPKRRMHLQLMAKSSDALFDFSTRLKQQLGDNVFIERHADRKAGAQAAGQIDGEWTLDASVTLGW